MEGKFKLWGGVFSKETAQELRGFLDSFDFDKELVEEDIDVTFAHAFALGDLGFISSSALKNFFASRKKIAESVRNTKEKFEDVHSAIEFFITKELGEEVGFNLRAGRSRNDEVITSLYLWVLRRSANIISLLRSVADSILDCAERNAEYIVPYLTHTRYAQPVLLSHLLLSYLSYFLRCSDRFFGAIRKFDVCHMGSGAGAGTSIIFDVQKYSKLLGFSKVSSNSIDSVGSRDNIAELIFSFTSFSILFSRIAEDMIFLSSDEVGFVELGEEICTGSSMMPQKKNPDTLELIRAKSSQFLGFLLSILTLEKGLLSGYSKDLQEDKKILFSSWKEFSFILEVMPIVFRNINGKKKELPSYVLATDIAEKLFLERKGSYREIHRKIGESIKKSSKLPLDISPEESVNLKRSPQSTNPSMVREKINFYRRFVKQNFTSMMRFVSRFSSYEFERRAKNFLKLLR
ncbi:Argininosuccinate lyase [bacterium HR19]|nr:Argininosuccinate lyase [bacterium HR19]